jgi:hypothetical protein
MPSINSYIYFEDKNRKINARLPNKKNLEFCILVVILLFLFYSPTHPLDLGYPLFVIRDKLSYESQG